MQPKKLDFINSLRGFAALYVLSFHFSLITAPRAVAPRWLAPFTGFGGSGVTLFFVVSAFTLSLSMDSRKRDESTPIVNYFLRRFFRIAPLFYLWIVLYCIRDDLFLGTLHSLNEIARSVFFVLNLSPGSEQGIVWASWTIGVEILFYMIFPVMFRLGNTAGKAGALFIGSLLVRSLWHAVVPWLAKDLEIARQFYNLSLLYHLPTFLFGIFVYRIYGLLDKEKAAQLGLGYLLVAGSLATLVSIAYGVLDLGQIDGLTAEAILYGALLLGLSITAPGFLVNRVTGFYGKISYSVYLSHAITIFLMSPVFGFIYSHTVYVTAAYAISLATALIVITALSYVTYQYIETPGNNIGRRIIRRLPTQGGQIAA